MALRIDSDEKNSVGRESQYWLLPVLYYEQFKEYFRKQFWYINIVQDYDGLATSVHDYLLLGE